MLNKLHNTKGIRKGDVKNTNLSKSVRLTCLSCLLVNSCLFKVVVYIFHIFAIKVILLICECSFIILV